MVYHAVMGFFGEEFGVTFEAKDKPSAMDYLRDQYPESSCLQLESPQDMADRQAKLYAKLQEEW